jgi:hypothetical protein
MKAKVIFIVSIVTYALLLSSQTVMAQQPQYSQAGIQYFNQRLDDLRCRQDGLALNGSLDLDGDWFAIASFADSSGDRACGSTAISAGGGYRTAFDDTFDMYATLSFETISPDVGSSDSGLILVGGLRGFIAQDIEGKVELAHHTVFTGSTTITAGGAFWFNRQFAATTDLTLSSNGTTIAVGARMNF